MTSLPPPQTGTAEDFLGGPLNAVEKKYAPEKLWAAGDLTLLHDTTRVAIVGTRSPSANGLNRSKRLAKALVSNGVVVVSGLARGIDRSAHETAIALGGRTIAVLGTPLDQCSPAEHRELQAQIASEHLALSQFAPGTRTYPSSFPARNRTMALISHATVIIEAGKKSGTISQAWEAIRLGRELFLTRWMVEESGLDWPQELLDYGARVLADEEDILAELPAPVAFHGFDAL